jgi:23S rRNA pseudouridine1911/1915/1917 synthase
LPEFSVTEETYRLTVGDENEGERLDLFLAWKLDKTRSRIQSLVREGKVSLDPPRNAKSSMLVKRGMEITVRVEPRQTADLRPEPITFGVVYQDEDLLVVDKPAGLIVHPSPGHWTGTLVHGLLHRFPEIGVIGASERPGIVHRLDGSTSGLMVVSRNERAHELLSRAFQERKVRKEYLGLVWGNPGKREGTIDLPVGRDPRNRYRMAVTANGKKAVTLYRTLWTRAGFSLVNCRLMTGRTHQIRVHMKHLGCPLAGDRLYAPRKKDFPGFDRVFLHSWILGFEHPRSGIAMVFRSFLHPELKDLLKNVLSTEQVRP